MGTLASSPLHAARMADRVEALAFQRMFEGAPPDLAQRLGLSVQRLHGAVLLLAPGLPTPMFNRVIGFGSDGAATAAQLADIAAVYAGAGVANWWLHWNPHDAPPGFAEQLRRWGWSSPARASWAKMLRGPQPAPRVASRLAVEAAAADQADAVAAVMAQAFEMPPFMAGWLAALRSSDAWRQYAMLDDGRVVGGGYLFVEGDCAWLGVAGVAPSHRKLGGQGALMARRIDDAAAAGARHIVTETGEPTAAGEANPSLSNMKRSGFTQVASRLNFMPPR